MKKLFIMMVFVSTNAMALDFDTEWAKFKNEFVKLKAKTNSATVPVNSVPVNSVPVTDADLKLVDPKAPERLGNHVSDPVLRERMQSLYKRDDVVVYSTTVR
jgi:hypothetical protein